MRPGRYAADDGSFERSAGGAAGRGVLLLAVALLIGIILLNATETEPPGTRAAGVDLSAEGDDDPADDATGNTVVTPSTLTPTTAATPARQPRDVKVLVVNASEVRGAAAKASDSLKQAQYNVLAPGNATPKESAVYFSAGFDREAAAVAGLLQFPAPTIKPLPSPSPIGDVKGANVVVVLGPDQATRFGAAPAAGATTTTAKPGTATTTTARAGGPTTTAPLVTTTAKP